MVAAISTTATRRLSKSPLSTPHHRPPLSPSEKTNHDNNSSNNADDDGDSISRKPCSKPRNSSSSSSSSSSNSLPKRSQSNMNSRPLSTTATRSLFVSFQGHSCFQTAKPKPISKTLPKKLSARTRQPNSPAMSLAAVRVLGNSVVFDDRDAYLASDSDSSGSEKARGSARGISVPARFFPENFSPTRRKSADAQSLRNRDSLFE